MVICRKVFLVDETTVFVRVALKRKSVVFIGIVLAALIIGGVMFYVFQSNQTHTVFDVLAIQTPQYDMTLEKPAAYINLSIRNNAAVDEVNVTVKLSGGFTNSSNEFPAELFPLLTRQISVIQAGETVTIPKIYYFGWYFFYKIQVSSSDGTNETFNQWVSWRSWQVPVPQT
jgi:hypothetical protein